MAGDVEAPQPTDAQQRHEAQMLGYVLGLFFFYVLHDALQERAFRTPGFEFGWFMTAVEIGTMFVCALAWEGGLAALRRRREADETATPAAARNYLALLVFAIALSQGTGSVALQHVNYPVKVAFKSCKLVPTMAFSRYIVRDGKRYGVDDYAAAKSYLVNVTGGTWYSTTRGGWCDGPDADPATCTWRATVDKVVNKTCANDVVHTAVEAFDAEHDRCFTRCPGGATGTARNTSSPCWVYCLFATLVGPQAMLPGGEPSAASSTARGAGVTMPLEQLENAFTHVFAHESEGGCPPLAPAAAASSVASVHSRPRASRAARALRREPWMWEP